MATQLEDLLRRFEEANALAATAHSAQADKSAALAALSQMRANVTALDAERDSLATTLDGRDEELAALRSELTASKAREGALGGSYAALEERARAADAASARVHELTSQLERMSRTEAALRAENASTESELGATSDDLRKMIAENALVSGELEAATARASEASARASALEKMARAHEERAEEILNSYHKLGAEASSLRASLGQAERAVECARAELRERDASLGLAREENARLDAAREQLLAELGAFEKQSALLSSTVASLERALKAEGDERRGAAAELESLKLVLGGMAEARDAVASGAAEAAGEKRELRARAEAADARARQCEAALERRSGAHAAEETPLQGGEADDRAQHVMQARLIHTHTHTWLSHKTPPSLAMSKTHTARVPYCSKIELRWGVSSLSL